MNEVTVRSPVVSGDDAARMRDCLDALQPKIEELALAAERAGWEKDHILHSIMMAAMAYGDVVRRTFPGHSSGSRQ
jgi:hypothetical protein